MSEPTAPLSSSPLEWRKSLRGSLWLLATGFVTLLSDFLLEGLFYNRPIHVAWALVGVALIGASLVRALETIVRVIAARGSGFGARSGLSLFFLLCADVVFGGMGVILAWLSSDKSIRLG